MTADSPQQQIENQEALIAFINQWCHTRPVRLCILFGSQATGRTHSSSDVDLALWPLPSLPPRTKLQWIVELEELLNKDVSLVLVSPDTDPVLGMEIVRYGIVVFEAEPELWFNKRLDLWHTYNDSLPLLRRQQESLQKYAEEVRRGT